MDNKLMVLPVCPYCGGAMSRLPEKPDKAISTGLWYACTLPGCNYRALIRSSGPSARTLAFCWRRDMNHHADASKEGGG